MGSAPIQKNFLELERLNSLYLTARFAFDQTRKSVRKKIRKGEIDPRDPIILISENDQDHVCASSGHRFLSRTKYQFPRYLRETIFVRLISALEVFLINVAREIFLHRRDIFHSDQRITFPQREILSMKSITEIWSKVLNSELRKLQNKGFKETVKFYDRILGIDIGNSPVSIRLIQEMHDRRHILVHRLGNTDGQYRRDYGETQKILSVHEDYLLNSISSIKYFAEFLWNQAENVLKEAQIRKEHKDLCIEEIIIETLSGGTPTLIDPSYHFYAKDSIVCLADIIESTVVDTEKSIITIKVSGSESSIKEYMKRITRAANRGKFILHSRKRIRWPQRKTRCRLEDEIIESIARNLPPQPWPKGIHKEIATAKNISNTQASAAITKILEDSKLKALIGEDYKPNNTTC